MSPFKARIEMKGRPVAYMIGFGSFILFFVAMFGCALWYGAMPAWFCWMMIVLLGAGSLSLFIWAGICTARQVYWSFEANEEKLAWFCSDLSGRVRSSKEVAVGEIVQVWSSRGSSDTSGGLYLKLRSGECVDIGGVAEPESAFLAWVTSAYPGISVKIDQ